MRHVLSLAVLAAVAVSACGDLKPPAKGKIRVAFALTEGATMIDFAGPWEVFQDVSIDGNDQPFRLYTVSTTRDPIRTSGGMTVIPDYTFDNAPEPDIVIVGAQSGSPQLIEWLRQVRSKADFVASVCTGAFQLARAGLLDGKQATTHHDFYDAFEQRFPKVKLVRGERFVESDPSLMTAGGLSSGIDLALHIVQRYYGRETAARTAAYMEYQGKGWERQAR